MRITLVNKESGQKLTGNARPKLVSIRAEMAMHLQRFKVCSAWLAKNPKHTAYLEQEGLLQDLGVTEIPAAKVKNERVPLIPLDAKDAAVPGADPS
jgi:hypothetical protein